MNRPHIYGCPICAETAPIDADSFKLKDLFGFKGSWGEVVEHMKTCN